MKVHQSFFCITIYFGRIPFATSIRFLHFSLILNKVFGKKVPLLSSLTVSTFWLEGQFKFSILYVHTQLNTTFYVGT